MIPLLDSERVRHASEHGDERLLAYTQEGGFARWLIEANGLDSFFRLMRGEDLTKIYGRDWNQLENDWRAMLSTFETSHAR